MLSFLAILILSFFLGMRHATDPDHVVAVTTIVTKQGGIASAGLIGALWGLGHTFTIFVAGTLIILFRVSIPPRLGLSMEFAVAAMLVLLGILNLTGTLRWLQQRFTPGAQLANVDEISNSCNDRAVETQPFEEPMSARTGGVVARYSEDRMLGLGLYSLARPFVVGIVHGLAGSAAVGLLVMTTIHDPWWSIAYLLLFGIGTIAGMMLVTAVMAMPVTLMGTRFCGWNRGMALASGLASLGFGLFLSYQIVVVDGLFATHPQWTPH